MMTEPTTPIAARQRPRLRVATLMAFVACCASFALIWRAATSRTDPEVDRALSDIARGGPAERGDAARVLGMVGPSSVERVVPALLGVIDDEDVAVRREATASLGVSIRNAAAGGRGDLAPLIEAAAPALFRRLGDPDPRVREMAVAGLGCLKESERGPGLRVFDPKPAVPVLSDRLRRDSSYNVRWQAALALGVIAPADSAAPTALCEALARDRKPLVRQGAAQALGRPWKDPVAPYLALIAALDDPESSVRAEAQNQLTRVAPRPPAEAISPLVRLLGSDEDSNRYAAARALGQAGPAAREAIPALVAAAHDPPNPWSRIDATMLGPLARIAPGSDELRGLLPDLLADADSTNIYARETALHILGEIGPEGAGPDADRVIAALTAHLADAAPGSREWAASSLARFGPAARSALPALRAARAKATADVPVRIFEAAERQIARPMASEERNP